MGLRDALIDITERNGSIGGLCKFGRICVSLDIETQDALKAAMISSASIMEITRALNDDGIKIRREFGGQKRQCFTNPNADCCLKNSLNEAKKDTK